MRSTWRSPGRELPAALAKLVAEIVHIDDALSRRARLKNPPSMTIDYLIE